MTHRLREFRERGQRMEYYLDARQGYQQLCCRMARAISRSVDLLDRGRCQEARELLARTREEVDRLIESPQAVTLHLEETVS